MIVLAVDLGERRVGFAICDAEERIASPLRAVHVHSLQDSLKAVVQVAAETTSEKIILGHPRNMNAKSGPKAKEAEAFAVMLQNEGLDVVLWDERLTTAEAERSMRTASLSRKQRKSKIDAVAAQRMLESYLIASRKDVL